MYAAESKVTPDSRLFYHQPGRLARDLYLYPTILGEYTYEPGYSLYRQHFHNYLLMYVEEGEMILTTGSVCREEAGEQARSGAALSLSGKTVETAQKNDFLLLDCRQPHQYTTRSGAHVLWVHFDGRLAGAYYDHITGHGTRHLLRLAASAEPGGSQAQDAPILMRNCYDSFLREQVPDEQLLSDLLTRVLRCLLHSVGPSASLDNVDASAGVRTSAAYITAHFDEPLPLQELARMANLSPYYYLRKFREETGMTPHQYLIRVRLDAAKYLLQTTDQPVAAIAQQCGFQDAGTFCTQFRRLTGATPRSYRQGAQALH